MDRHLAFVNVPGHGHVNPTLPVVAELVRRGWRVSYATHERFTRAVEDAGATLIPTQTDMPVPPRLTDFDPDRFAGLLEQFVSDARVDVPRLEAHFRQDPPQAVCYGRMSLTGRVLAGRLGLADVALVPVLASNEQFSPFGGFASSIFGPDQPALRRARQAMQDFAAEQGLGPQAHPMTGPPASLNIVFVPREFQPAADTFDERFRFVGPAPGRREDDPGWRPPPGGAPVLFISLGTAFNNRPDFFRMCLDAFGDGPWQVAMAVGERVDPGELGPVPPNVEVRPYFPQPTVLRHAGAFVSHAGMNSTMESLYYAVPLVTAPQMPEQEANARRVEELGLGRRLVPDDLTPQRLRAAVDEVAADERIRANLAAMRTSIREAGGAVAAADAIEERLAADP
ncbi:macrolide family glycosyltransferase [Pseudonocardia acidicola]|uniref:Glycosyl transferase n=1 Tax=Pseudonocardia acidicola TaxID=2724939 RepID=A0ABX1SDA2_9PSEU|nr:macrolide family glycosyltransferase [Pseudonocardia acidicola]NMH98837.1 glycosyl transferase [Pseudonocardia acidicola]